MKILRKKGRDPNRSGSGFSTVGNPRQGFPDHQVATDQVSTEGHRSKAAPGSPAPLNGPLPMDGSNPVACGPAFGSQARNSNDSETCSSGTELVEKSNFGMRNSIVSGSSLTANDPRNVSPPGAIVKSAPNEANTASRTASLKPLEIKVPQEIDKYVIGARLGSGTCGVVHKALDNLLGREVAIKLSPIGEAQISTGKVPGAQRAYQTEVYAAGKLRHPNIVTVFDAGQSNDLNYIVMEAIHGHSLKHYGKGQKLLPAYRALEVICECCKALDYSHRQGILHRDIKPANIMIGEKGAVKLLDFGIAVGLNDDSGLTRSGPTLGTPNYMSPEQILARDLTPASDFYSLGTVLFELLTGKQLFKAKKVKDLFRTVVHQQAPELADFRPDLTRGLSDVLAKALKKKPEQRFQSGMEMIDAFSPYIEQFKVVEQLPEEYRELLPDIAKLPFFESMEAADVARLVMQTKVRSVEPGESILGDGNFKRELLLLIDGVVGTESDNRQIHRLYGPGQVVGEYGFIHGARESRSYRAMCSQKVMELSTETLSHLAPKLHLHYYKQVSDVLLKRMTSENTPFSPDISL